MFVVSSIFQLFLYDQNILEKIWLKILENGQDQGPISLNTHINTIF